MNRAMQKKVLGICLTIALFESFASLSIEIYAIRTSATYVGASISITSVILAIYSSPLPWVAGMVDGFHKIFTRQDKPC